MKTLTLAAAGLAIFVFGASSLRAEDGCGFTNVSLYGKDDRIEYCAADKVLKKLADSTLAFFKDGTGLSKNAATGSFDIGSSQLRGGRLSEGERYREQSVGAFCSGFLVGKDLVVTAGHCVRDDVKNPDRRVPYCAGLKMAFGYRVERGSRAPSKLASGEVYGCSEVLTHEKTATLDYAVIRLDREVANHEPLAINRKANLKDKTPLIVMGYPSGLPLKIAGDAAVASKDEQSFIADLDTFGGNSGSPVFNAKTLLVEGILVSGKTDYEEDPANPGQELASRYQNSEAGERAIRVSLLSKYLPVHQFERDMLDLNSRTTDLYSELKKAMGMRNRGGSRTPNLNEMNSVPQGTVIPAVYYPDPVPAPSEPTFI